MIDREDCPRLSERIDSNFLDRGSVPAARLGATCVSARCSAHSRFLVSAPGRALEPSCAVEVRGILLRQTSREEESICPGGR